MAGIYQGDSRVFSVSATGDEGTFTLIGRQTEGSMEGEQEEIDANHKFSSFSDILPGRKSGNLSITVQDMDDDEGQEVVRNAYDNRQLVYIREEKWDLVNVSSLEPVRQTTGYVLSDPLGRDLSMDEIATAELAITRTSEWELVPAPTTTT